MATRNITVKVGHSTVVVPVDEAVPDDQIGNVIQVYLRDHPPGQTPDQPNTVYNAPSRFLTQGAKSLFGENFESLLHPIDTLSGLAHTALTKPQSFIESPTPPPMASGGAPPLTLLNGGVDPETQKLPTALQMMGIGGISNPEYMPVIGPLMSRFRQRIEKGDYAGAAGAAIAPVAAEGIAAAPRGLLKPSNIPTTLKVGGESLPLTAAESGRWGTTGAKLERIGANSKSMLDFNSKREAQLTGAIKSQGANGAQTGLKVNLEGTPHISQMADLDTLDNYGIPEIKDIKTNLHPESYNQLLSKTVSNLIGDAVEPMTGELDGEKLMKSFNDIGPEKLSAMSTGERNMADVQEMSKILGKLQQDGTLGRKMAKLAIPLRLSTNPATVASRAAAYIGAGKLIGWISTSQPALDAFRRYASAGIGTASEGAYAAILAAQSQKNKPPDETGADQPIDPKKVASTLDNAVFGGDIGNAVSGVQRMASGDFSGPPPSPSTGSDAGPYASGQKRGLLSRIWDNSEESGVQGESPFSNIGPMHAAVPPGMRKFAHPEEIRQISHKIITLASQVEARKVPMTVEEFKGLVKGMFSRAKPIPEDVKNFFGHEEALNNLEGPITGDKVRKVLDDADTKWQTYANKSYAEQQAASGKGIKQATGAEVQDIPTAFNKVRAAITTLPPQFTKDTSKTFDILHRHVDDDILKKTGMFDWLNAHPQASKSEIDAAFRGLEIKAKEMNPGVFAAKKERGGSGTTDKNRQKLMESLGIEKPPDEPGLVPLKKPDTIPNVVQNKAATIGEINPDTGRPLVAREGPNRANERIDIKDRNYFMKREALQKARNEVHPDKFTGQDYPIQTQLKFVRNQKAIEDFEKEQVKEYARLGLEPPKPELRKSILGESRSVSMRDDTGKKNMVAPKEPLKPFEGKYGGLRGFSSRLADQVKALPQDKFSSDQLSGILNKTAKKDEMKWLGMDDWLKSKPKVTKQEVLDFIDEHQVSMEEKTLGDKPVMSDKYDIKEEKPGSWSISPRDGSGDRLDGYSSRTEAEAAAKKEGLYDANKTHYNDPDYKTPGGKNYREVLIKFPPKSGKSYSSGHFSGEGKDLLAHARVQDFGAKAKGDKTLLLDEAQSDLHREGRKYGYGQKDVTNQYKIVPISGEDRIASDAAHQRLTDHGIGTATRENGNFRIESPEGAATVGGSFQTEQEARAYLDNTIGQQLDKRSVPDAPFKGDWHEMVMKTQLRDAVEKGYDRFAWTTGQTQIERWDLRRFFPDLTWEHGLTKDGKDGVRLMGTNLPRGGGVMPLSNLEDTIGQNAADHIREAIKAGTKTGALKDVKSGGEWAENLYDKAMVKFMDKYAAQWGGKVEKTTLAPAKGTISFKGHQGGVEISVNGRLLEDEEINALDKTTDIGNSFESAAQAKEWVKKYMPEALNEQPGKEVWMVKITPEMRKSIASKGQYLWKAAPVGFTLGAGMAGQLKRRKEKQ